MIRTIDMRANKENNIFAKMASRGRLEQPEVLSAVSEIIENVQNRGNSAVIQFTKLFDKVELKSSELRVSEDEIKEACKNVDKDLIEVIRRAKKNIEEFHNKQKENSWFSTEKDGVILGQLYRALDTVGIYVPGGTAVLTSSVLMNAIPAKVAGVRRIIMATPPGKDGKINAAVLAAAKEAGVDEIYKMGGAQAIAAMAFGTETVPKVDKIFGPCNIYVATAKRLVFGICDIDMFAGPSEILVIADETANAKYVAADLLSQAEHDKLAASVLVTTSETLVNDVKKELKRQFEYLKRKDILKKSLEDFGVAILVKDIDQAIEIANIMAPEHLELCIEEPFNRLGEIKNAGAIFLGSYSSEPLGDYFAGPNHVLPTGGTARFFSPLNVADYIKKTSVISYTKKALEKAKDDIILFAESEGLDGHANAIKVRFE